MISFSRAVRPVTKCVVLQTLPRASDVSKLIQNVKSAFTPYNKFGLSFPKRYSTTNEQHRNPLGSQFKELEIPIPGGIIAAKAWGSETAFPVLAVHGWLDNCGSFDKLLPFLCDQFYCVAIDMAGHGRSSHKPLGCVYTDISMVMDFKNVVDTLGWKKFHMLGHSLGGRLSLLFSCCFPDLVQKLMLLDTLKPVSKTEGLLPEMVFKAIAECLDYEKKLLNLPPVYTPEAAAKRLKKSASPDSTSCEIDDEGIQILLKRGTKASDCGKGLVFNRDLRLRPIESISLRSDSTIEKFMSALQCELLVVLAGNVHPYYQLETPETISRYFDLYRKNLKRFVVERVEGTHFVHLNNAGKVARIIRRFLLTEMAKENDMCYSII